VNGARHVGLQDHPIGARTPLDASERHEHIEQVWDVASRMINASRAPQQAIGNGASGAGQRPLVQVTAGLTIPRCELEMLLACLSRSSDCLKKTSDALDFFKRQIEDERKIVIEAVVAVGGMLQVHGR
jgi:hypothetical protein